jgi:hypothetical protein
MKKIFVFLSFILTLIIFQQCQKSKEIIDNNNNTQIILEESSLDKVLNYLKENNISITKDRNENELEYRNGFCYQNDPDSCDYIGKIYDTVYVPNVCNSVAVSYNLYWCEDALTLNFTDFTSYPLSPDCNDLWNYWLDLYNQGKQTEMTLSMDSLEYAASKVAEENIAYAFALYYGVYCPNEVINSNFSSQICYQYCIEYLGKQYWPPFDIFKVYCGSKCCKRTREFCILPGGGTYSSNEDYEYISGECDPNGPNFGECNSNWLYGECERECGPPPTN